MFVKCTDLRESHNKRTVPPAKAALDVFEGKKLTLRRDLGFRMFNLFQVTIFRPGIQSTTAITKPERGATVSEAHRLVF